MTSRRPKGGSAIKTEPATLISLLTALVTAIVGLATAFGADITDEQRNAVLTALAAVVPVIAAVGPIVRQFVVSPQTAANAVVMAKQDVTPNREVPAINVTGSAYSDAVRDMGFVPKPPTAN